MAARQYLVASGPQVAGTVACLPRDVVAIRDKSAGASRTPGNIKVYFDASGGMRGYVANAPNVMGDFVSIVGNFAQSSLYRADKPARVEFHHFGVYRFDPQHPQAPGAIADPRDYARPAVYSEANTNIADLLRWVQSDRHPDGRPQDRTLSVVVTDLMLDDRNAVDTFEASVGGVLRKMVIEDGLAVGILAVRVPFNGNIYLGSQTIQAHLQDRPLVILLMGDPYSVRSFFEYLGTSEIAPFAAATSRDRRAFTLFGMEPSSIVLADAAVSGLANGFTSRPSRLRITGAEQLPSFTFAAGTAQPKGTGGITVTLQADAGVMPYEVAGNQPLWTSSVWKLASGAVTDESCKASAAWSYVGNLPSAGWKQAGQTLTYALDAATMKKAGMDQKGVYLVQLLAGQQGIVENHPATAWMRTWSNSDDDLAHRLASPGGSTRVGVPELAPLGNVLLTEMRMPGQQAVKRTASQFIVQSE